MDRQGFSKVRRAELVARLTALDKQIAEQAGRAKFMREKGWHVKLADERLKLLTDSRRIYASALNHLLGEDFADGHGNVDAQWPSWWLSSD